MLYVLTVVYWFIYKSENEEKLQKYTNTTKYTFWYIVYNLWYTVLLNIHFYLKRW